ncbi:hypothetical protein HGRIS_010146 [Hohenbuehelia grisea]|uniref:HIG1 domain-containing protein n=1 Tax=Hohenbuehelia grisea TaxID=104357 RepID=A0ABR3J3D7_9AGAR
MKFATEQQLHEHAVASRRGAIEGGGAGVVAATAASYWAHRRFPSYRALPLSLKALGVIIVAAPLLAIQAERRGLEYDRTQWEGESVKILEEKEVKEEARWESLDTSSKLKDWALRHQYSLIVGGWALSLGVAGAVLYRDKYQTVPQKVVQARMWAQGLTISLLIAAGALTSSQRAEALQHRNTDHSWRDVLEQQEKEQQDQERAKLLAGRPTKLAVA